MKNPKAEKLYQKFMDLRKKAMSRGLEDPIIMEVFKGKTKIIRRTDLRTRIRHGVLTAGFLVSVLITILAVFCKSHSIDETLRNYLSDSRCLMENNGLMMEIIRPKTNCSMCKGVTEIPIEYDIATSDFIQKYAYTALPVLIKHATKEWSAMESFSFKFFKNLYEGINGSLEIVNQECQFFPYKTEFETLEDVLKMPTSRSEFQEGEKPWYVGWSNCDAKVASELRKHYKKPYFLPSDVESSETDWIFMGGPGLGAFTHLDYVQRPSWQAQISGKKTWVLIPTPECEHVCSAMNVTVHKGDIIVVDTNQWYHSTHIHPGEISITIGSEYD